MKEALDGIIKFAARHPLVTLGIALGVIALVLVF